MALLEIVIWKFRLFLYFCALKKRGGYGVIGSRARLRI